MRRWYFLLFALLPCSCTTSDDPGGGDGTFVTCNPVGEWLVTKLVIDLDNDGAIDPFPAGSLSDDVVTFNSDGSGTYVDNLSNSTGLVNFNWSCNPTTGVFEMFGIAFHVDEDVEKSLKISKYDDDLKATLEVDLLQP